MLTAAGRNLYEKVNAEAADVRAELLFDIDPTNLLIATELLELLQCKIDAKQ
jgi:hypothetical protein